MAKRKVTTEIEPEGDTSPDTASEESSSEDDTNMLDVEFEWFDPQPEHDFHGLKALLRQLFDADANQFDLSALADLVLEQKLVGSTVKVEGNATDPYAFLTILNLREHRDKPVIQQLINYVRDQSSHNTALSQITNLLASDASDQVGLILAERLLNIPSEVIPPMYNMLLEEISWALEEKEPFNFSHYLIFTKTYSEVASALDEDETRQTKKQRKEKKKSPAETFYFHPEDEILQKHAMTYGSFAYREEAAGSDSKRAFQDFGIMPNGHLILIDAKKFSGAVKALQGHVSQA